jgi:hypothetical protein
MDFRRWPWWRIAQAVFALLVLNELSSLRSAAERLDARIGVSTANPAGMLTPGGYSVFSGPHDAAGFTINRWLDLIEENTRPRGKSRPSSFEH